MVDRKSDAMKVILHVLLCTMGSVFKVVPATPVIRIPTSANTGLRGPRGAANAPTWIGSFKRSKQALFWELRADGKSQYVQWFCILQNVGYTLRTLGDDLIVRIGEVPDEGAAAADRPLIRNVAAENLNPHKRRDGIPPLLYKEVLSRP